MSQERHAYEVDLVSEGCLVVAAAGTDPETADTEGRVDCAILARASNRPGPEVGVAIADHIAVHDSPVRAVESAQASQQIGIDIGLGHRAIGDIALVTGSPPIGAVDGCCRRSWRC